MTTACEPLTNTGRVLLGMIGEGHATGYAIKAEIERSTRLYWGASVGGIYPELRRLAEAGLVAVRDDPRGGATRHAYSLTPAGHEALMQWLSDTAQPVLEMRNEPLLRLRFSGLLGAEQQIAIVDQMRAAYEQRAAPLRALVATGEFDDPMHRMTIEFALGLCDWAIAWCERTERALVGEPAASA